ncbi:protein takeout-like isoform X2 [Copidosoma floridanum]|uniref:protein takeout-like isoform X2 n=1 Tax=Copidosoma floridanum TaxID=29053 RepID=UPI000C6FA176|nr:protein takeout-like isoform X2 [Copidosoma floridanum]
MAELRRSMLWLLPMLAGCLVSAQVIIDAGDNPGAEEPDFPIPEYIKPCSRKDPEISKCIQIAFNHLRPYLVDGHTDLDVPPIEPLVIPELLMENGQGAVRVRAVFSNITAFGPGNYSISKVRSDIKNLRLDITLGIPSIEIRGRYSVVGQVLLFPIKSIGDFWAFFGDVVAFARVQGVEERRNGVRYMRIAKMQIDFKLERARFNINDKVNGDNVIGQAMNNFLNQNHKEIIDEMRPAASASIAKHFMAFLNNAFTKIPLKVWLSDT